MRPPPGGPVARRTPASGATRRVWQLGAAFPEPYEVTGCPVVVVSPRPCTVDPCSEEPGQNRFLLSSTRRLVAPAHRMGSGLPLRPPRCVAGRGVSCGSGAGSCRTLHRPGLPGDLQAKAATNVVCGVAQVPSDTGRVRRCHFRQPLGDSTRPFGSRFPLSAPLFPVLYAGLRGAAPLSDGDAVGRGPSPRGEPERRGTWPDHAHLGPEPCVRFMPELNRACDPPSGGRFSLFAAV